MKFSNVSLLVKDYRKYFHLYNPKENLIELFTPFK